MNIELGVFRFFLSGFLRVKQFRSLQLVHNQLQLVQDVQRPFKGSNLNESSFEPIFVWFVTKGGEKTKQIDLGTEQFNLGFELS